MIPVSLLLILVAVTLLALGLTSGSSGLLIASIVASLLAAVALVVGARRSAGARRAATDSPVARPAAPAEAMTVETPAAEFDRSGFDRPGPDRSEFDDAGFASPDFAAEFAAAQAAQAAAPAPPAPSASSPPPADFPAPTPPAAADSGTFTAEPAAPADDLDFGLDDEAAWQTQTREQVYSTQATPESEVAAAAGPDYDRASSAIHAARSEHPDENAWRRDSHAEAAAQAGLDEDFAEPDADDPDDEPLPQAVQPADAVRVARMDAEVLVVDGRPRYHLADCPHLVGRLTEPIPVNEAVELGFSPCGLCRPVDRLVAAAARR
jgi:hypothetical protein